MDQSDFRNMLATPRAGGSGQGRTFGAVQKRDKSGAAKEVFKKPEFKPRDKTGKNKFGKKKEGEEGGGGSSEATGGEYRDRAAERRLGVDSDFAGAEKLLSDFKARVDATDDKAAMEEQMKYLGGDEHTTVLVSGLDHALLTQRKYELSKATEKSAEEVEATLDQIFEQASSKIDKEPKKRSRDEMLSLLKASKGISNDSTTDGKNSIISDEGLEKAKAAGRFVSIGKPSKKGKEKEVQGGELKKRRKKKVKIESTADTTVLDIPTTTSTTASIKVEEKPILPIEDDFDDDIFGGVEDYKGLGSDSDSDDDTKDQKPKIESTTSSIPSTAAKASYFDEDDEEEMWKLNKSTAPSSVTNLQSKVSSNKRNGGDALEDGEEVDDGNTSMKLQPLAGSSLPSVRDLLAMDESAEREEKRKAKKLKFGGKEKEKKEYTQSEKDNRDHQLMMNHLEKQKAK